MILCGGAGVRLWPASRAGEVKALLRVLGERSLLQETALRLASLAGAEPLIVVAGASHAELARAQLAEVDLDVRLLVEPTGRDTAAAVLAAAGLIGESDPEGVALVVASDHHMPDAAAFAAAVDTARPSAAGGRIVTFGVRPTSPSTAYGYIAPGAPLEAGGLVLAVDAFVEKPDAASASAFVSQGRLWNSGNFLFRVSDVIAEARVHAPAVLEAAEAALAGAARDRGSVRLAEAFAAAPRIAFDVAVMERTTRAAVLPVDYAWSDVGAWNAVWAAAGRDADGNALSGHVVAHDVTGSLIRAGEGVQVIALGLRDIAVVAIDGRVLVADLSRTPELKPLVEALRST